MIKSLAAALSFTAVFAMSTALAMEPQEDRQASMKKVGGATGAISKMVKGEVPFDQAAAIAAFTTMNEVAAGYVALFPEGSETGFETEAAPTIWSDRAGFEAAVAKFEADTAAAMTAMPADTDALGASFKTVAANCGACHEVFRTKK